MDPLELAELSITLGASMTDDQARAWSEFDDYEQSELEREARRKCEARLRRDVCFSRAIKSKAARAYYSTPQWNRVFDLMGLPPESGVVVDTPPASLARTRSSRLPARRASSSRCASGGDDSGGDGGDSEPPGEPPGPADGACPDVALPPAVRGEVQRILDGAARRLLAERGVTA